MQNARFQNSSSYCKKISNTRYYSVMQQSVRNVCAKLKVDRLSRSRFHNRARKVFTIQKPFPSEIPQTMKNEISVPL